MRTFMLALTLLGATSLLQAQAAPPPPPPAKPEDVASVDAIIKAVYDVISGPAGQKRDWDRMRSLFWPGARLIPTGRGQDGKHGARVWTVEEYITRAGPGLPFARGVNSFQVMNDGSRWWILTIFWQGETPDNQIPAKFLNK
jgi:hypothetical protein